MIARLAHAGRITDDAPSAQTAVNETLSSIIGHALFP